MRQELSKALLTKLYLQERKSIRTIAEITGWSYPVVARGCNKYGNILRPSRREKIKIDKPILQKLYVEERKTVDEIASILSCNPTTILRRLKEYKIPVRGNRVEGLTKRIIQKLYVRDGKSTREIGRLLGCSRIAVQWRCGEYGIPLRPPRHTRIKVDEETLRRLYVTEGKSVPQVAKQVGCCYSTMFKRIKRYGLAKQKKRRKIADGKQ